ncbi:mediator of RNA polymerase II transcription subunit 14 isoform X2 [Gastrolobium bilobum]|uniref:mediator of RNA polymerase II transcription subunit 14 isoform X2 n=1 Tax=Gastrolobium bilobum TaxID=150636 RepID=UPI002AAFAAA0|nr:mediator of RNA polymerase II transcription subunit 14 isoform X2 [Gastrolobium bilobum]
MAAELGQQTVELSTLVTRTAHESYNSLKELVDKCRSTELSDTDKKISILKFLSKTQQRMIRLNVLSKWCQQVPLIQHCQNLASTVSNHDMCFTQAADSLFFMHEGLQQARAPVYDVPSAIEILLTGSYQHLPKCIEDVGTQYALTEDQQKPALKKLDMLVRSKLLEISFPKEISDIKVSDGTALVRVDGEFKVLVTLGYRGHLSMWRILYLELLVGEKNRPVKLEESRRHVLGDDLERRMAAAENPFLILYSVLHELCVALVMDTVIRQVQALRQGRWKDAIRFELIAEGGMGHGASSGSVQNPDGESDSSGLRTPGLKIIYWLDLDKNAGMSESGACPFIKIEPGPDLQIKCLHSNFVIDPSTGKEAEFSLDQSSIDVERLLLRAICCNRYTRLLEVKRELVKNIQVCRTADDVVVQSRMGESDIEYKQDDKCCSKDSEGHEVLRVRAYGSSFFTLGITIRNGRFLLQSSQNIVVSSALLECEEALNQGSMTAAEVFISLRSKSLLHLFASIGRVLGLEVYEDGFNTVKIPKNISNGSAMLMMGFPDCGSSYFLLMNLDKDFKPLFKLLETQPDPSRKDNLFGDLNQVLRNKKIDVGQMQVLEDEMNLSLVDWGKLRSVLPNAACPNQTSGNEFLSDIRLENSIQIARGHPSGFPSLVDEVFGLEKGSSAPPFSVQNLSSSLNTSLPSHYGPMPMNLHSLKAGTPSPKWEGGMQISQVNNVTKPSGVATHYSGSLFSSGSAKGPVQSSSVGSIPTGQGRSTSGKKISASKSEQDLASLKSPHSVDTSSSTAMDEEQLRVLSDTSNDALCGSRSSQLLSPPRPADSRMSVPSSRPNGPQVELFKAAGSSSCATTPVSQALESTVNYCTSEDVISKHDKKSKKRTASDMLNLIPSLQGLENNPGICKRRKISDSSGSQLSLPQGIISTEMIPKTERYSYESLIAEANKGNAPSSIYIAALLHVVRHCSLCIKHARLTSQMDALDISYVEEVGLRNASSNIWFRLPFARGDSWQHICLRLGRPGCMYWDVKINDQHFRDLWELQKGGSNTPWGSGVRIANTSDIDSHIHYDPDGVVLSYQSVEVDSIKKLVADIQRLANARTFALGMRKLLGIRADEKSEDLLTSSDVKISVAKVASDTADKLSEQMRRAFRIEAVGLMSLWFSFGSSVLARFVVEWESGKEGCTMHVSPDQLWPHTKFLEDFINGAEVSSLLDCIRLTAGPLHALAAATRPARAGPVPGVPAALSSIPKQTGYISSQGLLLSSSTTNVGQPTSGPGGNTVMSAASGLTNQTLSMLAAAGRGGPGIVPSSLLPIDVSVVLRGPYWIRIMYRKQFAVDMRCFAGDQVWLQPATPPKEDRLSGGSLPCPQFRPFIMEHVAQELNGLDPSFTGQQVGGVASSNNPNPGSGSQLMAANGNRINLPTSAAMSRTGNQVASLNRVGNALAGSSNLALMTSAVSLRRPPGTVVPAHVRGELNTAIIGLGDDGGYGGGWVPLVALKKVLRGILKYLGVLWLFAQLPDILKEILGSILKENEGALLNLDPEQPALRFFVGGYVFAVSVHRVQLLLQVLSVKRFHHQQQQQQQNSNPAPEELSQSEISEICDYFSRRVASEPYDASRVASFITMLTLPVSVLREFLKLIAWKKGLSQAQVGDVVSAQKPRIELCLENHAGLNADENSESSCAFRSNIHYDRLHNSVDFALTVVLDSAHIPHVNAAGGAAWLPYCVSVRLKYSFSESPNVSFLGMDGSHGGRACWLRADDWEKCRERVAQTVKVNGSSAVDVSQGRLKLIADSVQRTLHMCIQGLRDGSGVTASSGAT